MAAHKGPLAGEIRAETVHATWAAEHNVLHRDRDAGA